MADELTSYYEKYKTAHGDKAYRMQSVAASSRVSFLRMYLAKYVPKGGKVLDVGCGDLHLAHLCPEYEWVGVDIAPDMSDGRAVKHDLMTTPYPFEAGQFDGVVCSEVLEHLWDLRVVHKEIHRLLKPQGVYILSTPNYDYIDHKLKDYRQLLFDPAQPHLFEHIRQYNRETHTKFLAETGFKVVDYVGADAHFSGFFQEMRQTLVDTFNNQFGIPLSLPAADQIIGMGFRDYNHTIILASLKA